MKGLRDDARLPGMQLQMVKIRHPDDLDDAFRSMARERAQGVLALTDPMTSTHQKRLADLAIKHRLPLMSGPRFYTVSGGLMSYWADEAELSRRVASYVDRILKGADPASLPIEQPTKYELVVNLKTAKALALTIPPSLLLRATVLE